MKSLPISHLRFRLFSWDGTNRSLKNRFVRIAKSCDLFRVQHLGLAQVPDRSLTVHIVKEGETLTSISRKYGVPVYAIVVTNMDVVDVNLAFEGQYLQIPLRFKEAALVDFKQSNSHALDRFQRLFSVQVALESKKFCSTILSRCHVEFAKGNNLFAILVTIMAFLVIYMVKFFQHNLYNMLQKKASDKGCSPSESRGSRWRAALYDTLASDSGSKEEHELQIDENNQSVASIEEMSGAYIELEAAYLKFLSDCGMSKWGYWRGGSPK